MANVRLDRMAATLAIALAAGTVPALADDIFGANQMYMPGAVGTNIVDDTPTGPPPKSNDKSNDKLDSPALGATQAAPAAPAGGANSLGGPSSASGPAPGAPPGGNDFTNDEKRMQKKYKANIAYFKSLIAKGDAMMQKAPNQNDKDYKKGKIQKEIGEKHLADIQTNNPFNLTNLEPDDKKKDGDTASTTDGTTKTADGKDADNQSKKKGGFLSFFKKNPAPAKAAAEAQATAPAQTQAAAAPAQTQDTVQAQTQDQSQTQAQ